MPQVAPTCGIFFFLNVHPTTFLVLWLCFVLLAQKLPAFVLVPILGLGAATCSAETRKAWARLLYRSRWLLIVLFVTTIMMTPGESLWPSFPVTEEGLRFAAELLSRLVFVLFAVAWLLTRWPSPVFAGAICSLASSTGLEGMRRAAVRLALTLEVIGDSGHGRPLWRDLLGETQETQIHEQETWSVSFEDTPLGAGNRVGLAIAMAATAALWWILP